MGRRCLYCISCCGVTASGYLVHMYACETPSDVSSTRLCITFFPLIYAFAKGSVVKMRPSPCSCSATAYHVSVLGGIILVLFSGGPCSKFSTYAGWNIFLSNSAAHAMGECVWKNSSTRIFVMRREG